PAATRSSPRSESSRVPGADNRDLAACVPKLAASQAVFNRRFSAAAVAQAFQPAGSGDFPVATPKPDPTGLESPVTSQTGMSALQFALPPEHEFLSGAVGIRSRHPFLEQIEMRREPLPLFVASCSERRALFVRDDVIDRQILAAGL